MQGRLAGSAARSRTISYRAPTTTDIQKAGICRVHARKHGVEDSATDTDGDCEMESSKSRTKRADKQLNMVIPVFTVADGETAKMASVMLWWNLQLTLDAKLQGYGGDILEGAEASTVKPAILHNRTVRGILAYIVLNSRADGWIVAGPPQCLGFTPCCGLWFLIESVPSRPSYEFLLRDICKNL